MISVTLAVYREDNTTPVTGDVFTYNDYKIKPDITGLDGNPYTYQWIINGNAETPGNVTDPPSSYSYTSSTETTVTIQYKIFDDTPTEVAASEVLTLTVKNFLEFQYSGCDKFDIRNQSFDHAISYTITDHAEQAVIGLTDTYNVATENFETISFDQIGLFIVTVTFTPEGGNLTTEKYLLNTFCSLEDCLAKLLVDVFTVPKLTCDCTYPNFNEINYLRIRALADTYFMKLQAEYGFNNRYEAANLAACDYNVKDLNDIYDILKKLETVCAGTDCACGTNCGC